MSEIEPFVVLSAYRVLVCATCKFACVVDEVVTHLRTRHSHLSLSRRKDVFEAVRHIPDIVQSQMCLVGFPLPETPVVAIPYLEGPYDDGLRCHECPYVVRSIQGMQKHCRTRHGWNNERGRGGDVRSRAARQRQQQEWEVPWTAGVHCQRFFPSRRASGLFEVLPSDEGVHQPKDGAVRRVDVAARQHVIDAVARQLDRFQQHTTAVQNQGDLRKEASLWLSRVGWSRHLRGRDPARLRATVSLRCDEGWEGCKEDQGVLLRDIWDSFDRVVRQAQQLAMHTKAGLAVLYEINRRSCEERRPVGPFNSRVEPTKMDGYISVWKRVLGHILRVEQWDSKDQLDSILTDEQGDRWDRLTMLVRTTAKPWTKKEQGRIDRACLDAVVQLLDHGIPRDPYDSKLLSSLAVLGLREDGSWKAPGDYTQVYSAVIKVARMLVLLQSIREQDEAKSMALTATEGTKRDRPTLFLIVREKVRRFMTTASATTLPTPMGWILDARSYGLKLQFMKMAPGPIQWDWSRVTYQNVQLDVNEMNDMLHRLVGEMCRTMDDLLFCRRNKNDEYVADETPPAIDWAGLHDDMNETKLDYSFLTDNRNQWTVDGRWWLAERILGSAELRSRWLMTAPSPSETSEAAPPRRSPYSVTAVQRYGRLVRAFLERLLVAVHLLSGQPSRTTEIIGFRYRNTSYGGLRNIFVHNRMICLVSSYYKSWGQRDQGKVVHRFLPREVGELFLRYLWLVLPFWQQVQGLEVDGDTTSAFLWTEEVVRRLGQGGEEEDDDAEDREKIWSPDTVGRLLPQTSRRLLGTPINARSWRHLAVAIAQRYLDGMFGALRPEEASRVANGDGDGDESSDDGDSAFGDDSFWDSQTGRRTYTAGMIFTRSVEQERAGIVVRQEIFRGISMRWHRFWGFGRADRCEGVVPGSRKRSYELSDRRRSVARVKRLRRLQ